MNKFVSLICFFIISGSQAVAAPKHSCIADAHKMALKLLKFHYDDTTVAAIDEERTSVLKSFKNPAARKASKSRFEVIEVWGWVYKAGYRMRMIYDHDTSQGCGLVGQEILDWLPNER